MKQLNYFSDFHFIVVVTMKVKNDIISIMMWFHFIIMQIIRRMSRGELGRGKAIGGIKRNRSRSRRRKRKKEKHIISTTIM